MAYFDGDMDSRQIPVVDRMDKEYTIYVNSLPAELNKGGIRDIFSQYGEVTQMFYPPNATWAFVTFATYREAELAIRELNNKKPLNLKVALAKERSTGEEQKSNVSEVNFEKPKVIADSLPVPNDIKYRGMGRGQPVNAPRRHVIPQISLPHRAMDCGSLSSLSSPLSVYDIEDPYINSNKLWTRGVVTVTPDGKKHVSLGRGYTLYEFPEPDPNIEEYISSVYEQRNNGLYEYSEDKFKNAVQSCSVCSTKTTKHCEKCHTYYCSKACQLEDWPQHQAECERVPALVEDSVSSISALQINQDQKRRTSIPNKTRSTDVKLRRPNTPINATQAESASNTSANINMHKNNTEVTHNSNANSQDKHAFAQRNNDNDVLRAKMANQPVVNNTSTKESQHRLRMYNNTNENTNQSRKSTECSPTSSFTDQSRRHNSPNDTNKTNFKESYTNKVDNNSNVKERNYNNDKNRPKKNNFQSDKSSANFNDRANISNNSRQGTSISNDTSVNDELAFYKDTHLSKTKFITVEVIIPLGNDEYWIYKLEDEEARNNLMIQLQDVVKESRNVQPIIGEVYGIQYETIWHRATVISLNPIKVHFIDFGNDEILDKDSAVKDIKNLSECPKFARKIRLTQGTSDKYRNLREESKISVRLLSVDSDNTLIVEVEEEQQSTAKNLSSHTTENASNNAVKNTSQENLKVSPNKSTKASIDQIPNILDALADLLKQQAVSELKIEGGIQFCESVQKNIYCATLTPHIYADEIIMIFNDLQEECTKMQTFADYKPKPEDLICGNWKNDWYRGYIMACPETSSKLAIISVDEGRILSVDKIVPCPKSCLNICSFGVMCEINHSTAELKVGEAYDFTAIVDEKSYKQDNLKIEIIGKNLEKIQGLVKSWKLTNSSTLTDLKNGSKICLTSYRSHYYMFARSLEEDDVEYYNNIMQSVTKCAQTAPCLTEPPYDKQLVIAPYEDGNNYRAMVLKTQKDKAKIVYIDFGNLIDIDIKDLKVMPHCHSQQQSFAAKVILKDVPRDVPMNEEVDLYLRNLTGKEVPLICTFEGSSKDGVRLTMLTGECINDKINELLIPTWKKEDSDDNRCYMLKDMEIASLGKVGATVEAMVLFVQENDQTTYVLSPLDMDLMNYVITKMPEMLKEYCEKTEYYIPRKQELCLALYDGSWYRAACIDPKESHVSSQILFIDYGNIDTVKHKDIRYMPKDFLKPESLANLCTVVNLAPVNGDGKYSEAVQKKLKELVLPDTNVKIKIMECLENGVYKIELPEIHTTLHKLGLV